MLNSVAISDRVLQQAPEQRTTLSSHYITATRPCTPQVMCKKVQWSDRNSHSVLIIERPATMQWNSEDVAVVCSVYVHVVTRPIWFPFSFYDTTIFVPIDLSQKSHNAQSPCPTKHHFVIEVCVHAHISVAKWSILWYLPNALGDSWDGSILVIPIRSMQRNIPDISTCLLWCRHWSKTYNEMSCGIGSDRFEVQIENSPVSCASFLCTICDIG